MIADGHNHRQNERPAGSTITAALKPLIDAGFTAARRAGTREPREAYGFDALMALAQRDSEATSGPASTSVKHLGIVRVDFEALRRGSVDGDEVCEIAGLGPISVPAARALLGDSVLKLVITRGVDVNVTHLGRGLTAAQQVAQWWLQPSCTTLSCPRWGRLENDHRVPYAKCRQTSLINNDPMCPHCHRLKTYEGWAYVKGTGRRPLVPPEDPRHPTNANAPPGEDR